MSTKYAIQFFGEVLYHLTQFYDSDLACKPAFPVCITLHIITEYSMVGLYANFECIVRYRRVNNTDWGTCSNVHCAQ